MNDEDTSWCIWHRFLDKPATGLGGQPLVNFDKKTALLFFEMIHKDVRTQVEVRRLASA